MNKTLISLLWTILALVIVLLVSVFIAVVRVLLSPAAGIIAALLILGVLIFFLFYLYIFHD